MHQFCDFRQLSRFLHIMLLSRFYLSEVINHALDDEIVTVFESQVQIENEAIAVRFIQDLEKAGFSKLRKETFYLGPEQSGLLVVVIITGLVAHNIAGYLPHVILDVLSLGRAVE